ncbi:ABC transporter substrate-binding protein [Alkalicoccus urumqiensis]|nr:ABC transporter substrate-binding protein [Alkalicoccus urumqiensis]
MKRAALCAAAGAFFTLAACGGNEGDTNTTGNNNSGENNEMEETAEENAEESDNEEENINAAENNEPDEEADNEEEAASDEEGSFPITITDDAGNEVTIEEEPESFVTLQPSETEILFELGAGDRLVGVDEFSNYPEEAAEIETVGAQDMDAERILQLEPDVIFVSDYHQNSFPEVLDQYRDNGSHVVVTANPTTFDGTFEAIEEIGTISGRTEEAEELVTSMQEELDELRSIGESIPEEERKTVWVEVAPSPEIFTTGQGTFMHDMLEVVGAENAAAEYEGWVEVTEEEILVLEPDTILTTYGYYVDDPQAEVTGRDGWGDVPAVADEDIHDVDADMVTRAGPRLVDGTRLVGEAVYPDAFE